MRTIKFKSRVFFANFVALWLLQLCQPANAQDTAGPSFNCAKANSSVEFIICGNPDLSRLDREVGRSYFELKKTLEKHHLPTESLVSSQRVFLANRTLSCAIPETLTLTEEKEGNYLGCLKEFYSKRLRGLRPMMNTERTPDSFREDRNYSQNSSPISGFEISSSKGESRIWLILIGGVAAGLTIFRAKPPFDRRLLTDTNESETTRREIIVNHLIKNGYIIQRNVPGLVTAVKRKSDFSLLSFIILSLTFILPGLLYLLHYATKRDRVVQYAIASEKRCPKIFHPHSRN